MLEAATVSCPAGQYNPDAQNFVAMCILCETGTFSSTAGTVGACAMCSPGKYSASTGASQCVPCSAGTFSHFEGSSVCTACPDQTGSGSGMSACMTCSNSTSLLCLYANGAACPQCASACVQCNAGYYSDGVSNGCVACDRGKFYSLRGAVSSNLCSVCSTGSYTPPRGLGMSSCLECSSSGAYKAPPNAKYSDLLNNGFVKNGVQLVSPVVCYWQCNEGYALQNVAINPDVRFSLMQLYRNQGFDDTEAETRIEMTKNYCCYAVDVGIGQKRTGCSKTNPGKVENCPSITDGKYTDEGQLTLDRCMHWACNEGFYKSNDMCIAQPVCDDGQTYRRTNLGELDPVYETDPSTGTNITASAKYVCVPCLVCAHGTETVIPCNRTHAAVCRMCGGNTYSVNGGRCVGNVPYGFRQVYQNRKLLSIPWGQRPVMLSDNRPLQVLDSQMSMNFYYFIACLGVDVSLAYRMNDQACNADSANCNQCNTECAKWKRGGGWFQGVGWYRLDDFSSCIPCTFQPSQCQYNQFLNMSKCGPVDPPQCEACPVVFTDLNQVGWTKPVDPNFDAPEPCRVVCKSGYVENGNKCLNCPAFPSFAVSTDGCNWTCMKRYQRVGNSCEACQPLGPCGVGYYPNFPPGNNVCLECVKLLITLCLFQMGQRGTLDPVLSSATPIHTPRSMDVFSVPNASVRQGSHFSSRALLL